MAVVLPAHTDQGVSKTHSGHCALRHVSTKMYVMTAGVQRGDKRDPAVRVWDLATGVAVRAYRGGVVTPSGLAVTSAGLMLAAQKGKPAIHAWQLHAEPMHIRIPLSEGCTSLTCTADGATCVAGTASGR